MLASGGERNASGSGSLVQEVEQTGHCGLSKDRVGDVLPMAMYTGLGGGISAEWDDVTNG